MLCGGKITCLKIQSFSLRDNQNIHGRREKMPSAVMRSQLTNVLACGAGPWPWLVFGFGCQYIWPAFTLRLPSIPLSNPPTDIDL